MAIRPEILDEILKEYDGNPETFWGKDGIFKELSKGLIERAMKAEMAHHLGYKENEKKKGGRSNHRNGNFNKKIKGDSGEVEIEVPRDRNGSFEPQIVKKGESRITGMDDKIISMYARGMSVREIQGHLEEIYGVEVSADLISTVTDAVIDEVQKWQSRALQEIYPIVYLDALVVKGRNGGKSSNRTVYLAIGINIHGVKEPLGLWIEESEGAKFWLKVITELKNRGVQDIFIACVDGLKGFPDAIEAVFPETDVQLCIVHMVRNSLKFVSYKHYKEVTSDLKTIYRASTLDEAELNLKSFAEKWDSQYPTISRSWKNNWARVIPFFDYPPEIRKIIYTTNAIESINMSLRKVIKNRCQFPNDMAILKLLYLGLMNLTKKWTRPIHNWKQALNQFAIKFEDRFPGN